MNKFLLSAALCCVAGSAFAGSITLDKGASKSEQSAKNDFAKYFNAQLTACKLSIFVVNILRLSCLNLSVFRHKHLQP